MSFEEHLEALVNRLDGCQAAMVTGFDGIRVASALRDGAEIDLDLLGAETAGVFTELRRSGFSEQTGQADSLSVRARESTVLLRRITDDYYVALILSPSVPEGKGWFHLTLAWPALERELS